MMKVAIFSLAIVLTLMSCNKKDIESEIVGKYQLIEILADPGDGSGVFEAVSSQKTIEFKSSGDVESNGDICSMTLEATGIYEGTYSVADTTIYPDSCTFDLKFSVTNNQVIIYYPCIEACQAKYKKQ